MAVPSLGRIVFATCLPRINMDKVSTKIRVVFNASEKGPGLLSLNRSVNMGPNLNTEMVKLLFRFRSRPRKEEQEGSKFINFRVR